MRKFNQFSVTRKNRPFARCATTVNLIRSHKDILGERGGAVG